MTTLKGLTTQVITADDVAAASAWYAEVFGQAPYFRRPEEGPVAYVEFRVGPDEDEFGIMDRSYAPGAGGLGTSTTYWQVSDVATSLDEFVARGATMHSPPVERGAGFITASIVDPFGNVLGLMHSPHWSARHQTNRH